MLQTDGSIKKEFNDASQWDKTHSFKAVATGTYSEDAFSIAVAMEPNDLKPLYAGVPYFFRRRHRHHNLVPTSQPDHATSFTTSMATCLTRKDRARSLTSSTTSIRTSCWRTSRGATEPRQLSPAPSRSIQVCRSSIRLSSLSRRLASLSSSSNSTRSAS
jgi:hypothetical protein